MNRRRFLKHSTAAGLAFAVSPVMANLAVQPEFIHLSIVHTNDMHSRIEPFPMDGGRNAGKGGMSRRAALIEKIRQEEGEILLLDSGDIFQGTPYFNYYGGELEFKLMSKMGYDAVTLGNHDFDGGLSGLHKQLPHASFDIVTSNYDFRDTILEGNTFDYKIYHKKGVKIGVFGVGIELQGLVPADLYGKTKYQDPINIADNTAKMLKQDLACDVVVCLSHLGYQYSSGHRIDDVSFAEMTENIDIILGGHTHTFMSNPDFRKNKLGEAVMINQAGWGGILLGKVDILIEKTKRKSCLSCRNLKV